MTKQEHKTQNLWKNIKKCYFSRSVISDLSSVFWFNQIKYIAIYYAYTRLLKNALSQIYTNLFSNQFFAQSYSWGVGDMRPYTLVVHEFHNFSRRLMLFIIMNFCTCRGRGLWYLTFYCIFGPAHQTRGDSKIMNFTLKTRSFRPKMVTHVTLQVI